MPELAACQCAQLVHLRKSNNFVITCNYTFSNMLIKNIKFRAIFFATKAFQIGDLIISCSGIFLNENLRLRPLSRTKAYGERDLNFRIKKW